MSKKVLKPTIMTTCSISILNILDKEADPECKLIVEFISDCIEKYFGTSSVIPVDWSKLKLLSSLKNTVQFGMLAISRQQILPDCWKSVARLYTDL